MFVPFPFLLFLLCCLCVIIYQGILKYLSFFKSPSKKIPLLSAYVRAKWNFYALANKNGTPLRIAIFGAGKHTEWLLNTVYDEKYQPTITAIIDERPIGRTISGAQVITPCSFNTTGSDAILVSTDTYVKKMTQRCKELFGNEIPIINLYDGLPPGPYPKEQ